MNETYRGGNKLILGIVLGVITFWLFAQSLVNVVPNLQQSFGTDMGTISIAVSLTALFSGMFVVGAGGLADKIGRVKMTNIGLLLSIIGSALIIITNLPALLILGRIIQGVSAACLKLLVYRFLGWKWYLFTLRRGSCDNYGLEMDFHLLNYRCRTFNVTHQRDA
ncbi:antibiotic resistance-related transmembrane efflux protein [Staphylococcus aureus]|nr:antibiotic resistance-related transmembrane efflux protein [Staphylococcus aureus]